MYKPLETLTTLVLSLREGIATFYERVYYALWMLGSYENL